MAALLAPLALLLERLFGYPQSLLRVIGHPVMWVGALIARLDRRMNRPDATPAVRRTGGVIALLALLAAVLVATLVVTVPLRLVPFGWVVEAVLATSLLAQKELGRAVAAVATGLETSLAEGRRAVSHIVGRDPETLDEAGVARAAIESLAESSSDAVVAPLFWLLLLGLPGIALYKAINTADSMIGHKSEKYLAFGWAGAKLDDLANWIPARLTALLLAGAAFFVTGAEPERAWSTAIRDARKHDSPNAGWPEAAVAGALGLSLGGPRSYDGQVHDLPAFGDGRNALTAADIRNALTLYRAMLNLLLVVSVIIALVIWRL